MQLSLPHLLSRFAIFLVSLEGIVRPEVLNFVVENFGDVDIYSYVSGVGNNRTGELIFTKSNLDGSIDNRRQKVIQICDILRTTFKRDATDSRLMSFSVHGVYGTCHLKFKTERQANLFINERNIGLSYFTIRWARIYSPERPVIVAYDQLADGELAFKVLISTDFTNVEARLSQLLYIFMRSDLENGIKRSPPHTLYLRNKTNIVDYKMVFKSKENMDTFLALLPDKVFNEHTTQAYFHGPRIGKKNTSKSQGEGSSSSHDASQ